MLRRDFGNLGFLGIMLYIWGLAGFALLVLFDWGALVIVYAIFVVGGYLILYLLAPRRYFLTIFLLCLIEETIVYYLGGGLHGYAKSLLHDYARSLPIFMTHAFMWYRFMNKYNYSDSQIMLLAGLHGFFWEILLPGASPLISIILGGTPFIFYGLLVIIPERPQGTIELKGIRYIVEWFYILIVEIIIGILSAVLFP